MGTKHFRPKIFGSHISIPNDPKIPKITLRTACHHYKNTNNAHEKKVPFFSYYLPSGGSQVREPSVHQCFFTFKGKQFDLFTFSGSGELGKGFKKIKNKTSSQFENLRNPNKNQRKNA